MSLIHHLQCSKLPKSHVLILSQLLTSAKDERDVCMLWRVLEYETYGVHWGYKRDTRPKRQKRKSNLNLVLFEVDEM
jgi:hypothetical protein